MKAYKVSIEALGSGACIRGWYARIYYHPFALFDIGEHGIKRHPGIYLPTGHEYITSEMIGGNGAVRVLREECEVYPQSMSHDNSWDSLESIASFKAKNGEVVTTNGVHYYIHVYKDLPYLMASYDLHGTLATNALLRITDDGLQVCGFISDKVNIALTPEDRPLVWRVK